MLETLKNLLAELTGGKAAIQFEPTDYRLAAAALMVHACSVDGEIDDAERDRLREILQTRFGLDEEATRTLIDEATEAENEAVDLYRFTSQLNRSLDEDGRRRVVEMLWEIVYADGRANEFEDNLLWRAADLLGISSRDRIALRQRVGGERSDPAEA
jgi:uncharacterized tellurite resistance protein B-like protein